MERYKIQLIEFLKNYFDFDYLVMSVVVRSSGKIIFFYFA